MTFPSQRWSHEALVLAGGAWALNELVNDAAVALVLAGGTWG